MSGAASLSVVLATLNRAQMVARVVRRVLEQDGVTEVVVVDDGSTDGTPQMLARLEREHPRVRAVRSPRNVGAARARRRGVEEASGELILCLDDDVVPAPGLVERHLRWHAEHPDAYVHGYMPVVASPKRRSGDFAVRLYARAYEERCAAWERDPSSIATSSWGGNCSFRRDSFLAATEGYDWPAFYVEDQDLGLRMHLHGAVMLFDRMARGEHHYVRDFAGFIRDGRRQGHGLAMLHALYPELLGGLDPAASLGSGRGLGHATVRLSDRPRARSGVLAALRVVAALAGRTGRSRAEERAGTVARLVAERSGMRVGFREAQTRRSAR